ncbi:MAG: ABC transporter ATP-binding protein [Roseibium sp.]
MSQKLRVQNDVSVIEVANVSKVFELYDNHSSRTLSALNLGWLVGKGRVKPSGTKTALLDISLKVKVGEKVGIIGRNGSGKTTLLRLIIDQIAPSSGQIIKNGSVQAMMQTGFGFNEELTGYQNVSNSLLYNGLTDNQRSDALDDVIDFVELGEFINYPLKTYSLGMAARLEFATATAIHPDVLVVDEVLGAGDGYFARKSADRIRHLIDNCTLLLVSHSMQQIEEYCDRVIWLDNGILRADGPASDIVLEYEKYMAEYLEEENRKVELHQSSLGVDEEDFFSDNRKAEKVFMKLCEQSKSAKNNISMQLKACFELDEADHLVCRTGDDICIRLEANVVGKTVETCETFLWAVSPEGTYIFEATGATHQLSDGSNLLFMSKSKLNAGIGNYFLRIGLRHPETKRIISLCEDNLMLRLLPTNYSDPPYVHLEGMWSGDNTSSAPSRIDAWV